MLNDNVVNSEACYELLRNDVIVVVMVTDNLNVLKHMDPVLIDKASQLNKK